MTEKARYLALVSLTFCVSNSSFADGLNAKFALQMQLVPIGTQLRCLTNLQDSAFVCSAMAEIQGEAETIDEGFLNGLYPPDEISDETSYEMIVDDVAQISDIAKSFNVDCHLSNDSILPSDAAVRSDLSADLPQLQEVTDDAQQRLQN